MTREEVFEQLQSYRATMCRIKGLEEEIQELRLLAIGTGCIIGDGMPHASGSGDAPFIKSVNRLVDATQEQREEMSKLQTELYKTTSLIQLAPTRRGRDMLELRFRYGWSMKRIANEWNCSDRNIRKIQAKAIEGIANRT